MIKYSSKNKNQNLPSKTQIYSYTYTTIKIPTYFQFKKRIYKHNKQYSLTNKQKNIQIEKEITL